MFNLRILILLTFGSDSILEFHVVSNDSRLNSAIDFCNLLKTRCSMLKLTICIFALVFFINFPSFDS